MTAATAWVHGLSQDVQVGGDMLAAWAESIRRRQAGTSGRGGPRFAFYGRVSTEDWQDPVTSRARQRDQAAALVAGHGRIVAEFFDVGYSRTRSRPASTSGPSTAASTRRWRRPRSPRHLHRTLTADAR